MRCLKAMIERIALDALALRSQLPDLRLREGASVVARVAARQADHGVIVLAGAPLGIAIFDREGRYLRVSEELAAINGRPVAAEHLNPGWTS